MSYGCCLNFIVDYVSSLCLMRIGYILLFFILLLCCRLAGVVFHMNCCRYDQGESVIFCGCYVELLGYFLLCRSADCLCCFFSDLAYVYLLSVLCVFHVLCFGLMIRCQISVFATRFVILLSAR